MLLVKDLALLNGRKVSMKLDDGGAYVLRGSNGSGKTLLLRSLAGLYVGTSAEFVFNNKRMEEFSPEEFRSRVMYVSPSTSMSPDMTVDNFLAAPLKLAAYKDFTSDFPTKDYLTEWGIAGKTLGHLSSGQKQLLGLLRALTLKADILLLDEPTSHMDQEKTLKAESLLRDWKAKDPARIILLVSHSEEQASRMGTVIRFEDIQS